MDFITQTGLCWDVILEISKYLSLNDLISAFSTNIISLLNKYKTRAHLFDPSDTFIRMIRRKLNPEQIVSFQLSSVYFESKTESKSLAIFNKVMGLTFLNLQALDKISEYGTLFPDLTRLSLRYDNEVNFNELNAAFNQLPNSIKRFEIHCAGLLCTDSNPRSLRMLYKENFIIEYFLFDMGKHPLSSTRNIFLGHNSSFLMMTIKFIRKMVKIQRVCFVTNKYNIEEFLAVDEWMNLVRMCRQLKKVTLKVLESMSPDEQLTQKVLKIQKELHNVRQTIKFQVIFS